MLEQASQSTAREGRLLMQELSHRINNEYTSAINVLSLAAARSRSSEVKAALHDASERLHRYADVHRMLEMPEHPTCVDAAQYLRQLCLSIQQSKLDYGGIELFLAARPLQMQSDRCWRLGMIVYELINNAARHAFRGPGGEISVELQPDGDFIECRVCDNGSATREIRPGRGLYIIRELAKRIDGRLVQNFGPRGSQSSVFFPA